MDQELYTNATDARAHGYFVPVEEDEFVGFLPFRILKSSYLRHHRASAEYAISVILGFGTIVAVVLRYMARRNTKQKFGWDDYTIVLALVNQPRSFPRWLVGAS